MPGNHSSLLLARADAFPERCASCPSPGPWIAGVTPGEPHGGQAQTPGAVPGVCCVVKEQGREVDSVQLTSPETGAGADRSPPLALHCTPIASPD